MQTNETTIETTVPATVETPTGEQAASEATAAAQAKLAKADLARKLQAKRAANVASGKPANAVPATSNGKAAAKRVKAAKASKPAGPAKPTSAEREAARIASNDQRSLARRAAAGAIGETYAGTSCPFKAAGDTFSPINHNNAKPGPSGLGTPRQAALLLALITYGAGNLQPNGHFKRGGFVVPAKLAGVRSSDPNATVLAQPESGALGNTLGLTTAYVSGPTAGAGQRDAIYRIDFRAALKLIKHCFGDKPAQAAEALIPTRAPKPAKAA